MSFEPKLQAFNSHVNTVVLGTGEKAITIGGQNVMPFYSFDAAIENAPKIGVEISDIGMDLCTTDGMKAFYDGCTSVVDMAKRAETMEGASFICLHLESADPNGADASVEDCVALAKSVSDAITMPLVVMGCKNVEKDAEIFNKVSGLLRERIYLSFRHVRKTIRQSVRLRDLLTIRRSVPSPLLISTLQSSSTPCFHSSVLTKNQLL